MLVSYMNIFFKLTFLLSIITLSLFSSEKISLQLLWKHQFEFAGFYIAKEKGFYKDVHLDVELKEYNFGTDIVEDVLNGTSDFGIGRSSLVLSKLKGKDIVLLNALYQNSPYVLISKKRPDLQTIKDFKDKKIMLSDDLESLAAISSMMKANNITSNDYTYIEHSFNIEDLINDKVDLITTYLSNEPFHLQEKNIEFTIFDPKDYGFNFYSDILFTSQKYLTLNSQKTLDFQEATLHGWHYAFNHIEETVELILQKYNPQNKSREALLYEAKVLKKLACMKKIPFGTLEETRVEEIANIYKLLGMSTQTNKSLKSLIYKPKNIIDFVQDISLEIFIALIVIIIISLFLGYYKQYILKKQNINLESIVDEKTKELQLVNENLERTIHERTRELETALHTKSDFLANMSHEIRTPLNGIIGFVDILYKNEYDTQKQEKLKIIKESSHSLLTIINDILDFSKIESGKVQIEYLPIDIHHIFHHIVELFFDKANEKDISLILNIDKNVPLQTLGDSVRLKQVFSNILSNAIKFSDKKSEIVVNLTYLEDVNKLYCEVEDNGIGIASENIDAVFNFFEQADGSVSRLYGGTGLGLAISKSLVENMGGQIGVRSILGEGSVFHFTIKLFEVEDKTEIEETETQNIEDKKLQGLILIVEDNKTNQMLLSMILDDLDLDVDIANDGVEAVEAVQKREYNLILMDENMPNMNGKVATQIIRKTHSAQELPIVAVTANALKGDRETFIESGMNDYLAKPIDIDELTTVLYKYL